MSTLTAKQPKLKAQYPYPGGKSKVADRVWSKFGNVDNFVEPFYGSGAVLINRPAEHFANGYRVETVNDLNHHIANYVRAVKADPEAVAYWADGPVQEADLHARHLYLTRGTEADAFRERVRTDADYFDAKRAGWWVWGQCCWIGGGWCNDVRSEYKQMPQIDAALGVHRGPRFDSDTSGQQKHPCFPDGGIGRGVCNAPPTGELSQQVPDLTSGACGVHRTHPEGNRPQLADAFDIGRGVHANGNLAIVPALSLQVPELSQGGLGRGINGLPNVGTCDARLAWLTDWTRRLSDRFRQVRTLCGHWARACDSDSTMTRLGVTGVFLDPPYPANRGDTGDGVKKKSRDATLYATDKAGGLDELRDEVLDWCIRWGNQKDVRAIVCGYEGDGYEELVRSHGWAEESWEANGGYANQRRAGKGKAENAKRERLWLSPGCVKQSGGLFDTEVGATA